MAKHVSADLHKIRKLQLQTAGQSGPSLSGVASWNGRKGAVVLTAADLSALGVAFTATSVASFNTRHGAVTLTKADVTGTGLTYTDVAAVGTAQIGAASGVAGLDASSRLMIPAGITGPSTGTGAIGVGTLVGWIPVVISGVQSKIPIFQ